jgi:hypothetical protein
MRKQNSARLLALLAALVAAPACSGDVMGSPTPPNGDDDDESPGKRDGSMGRSDGGKRDGGTSPGSDGDDDVGDDDTGGDDDAPVSEEEVGIGTSAFALCNGGDEQPAPRLLRLLTRREFKNTMRDLIGAQEQETSALSLPLEPRVRGFDNNARASVVTSRHADEYLNAAQALVDRAVRERKGQFLQCQPTDATCAKTFVQKFGLKAFRRPLTQDEVARYEAMFDKELTGNNFDEGLKLAMTAMLVSPNFLYRSEVGDKQSNNTFTLTPYETASALSYLYWGSMPDQALFDAAEKKQLGTKAELETQARRLLADNKAKDQLAEFSLQWLRSDSLMSAFKDNMIYPMFQDGVRKAMIEEQKRFFIDVAITREGKFAELYNADYVFANGDLARFYGLPQGGGDYAKMPVTPDSQRGGILSLGAVLASHAHSNESSPIKRGVFVRDRLLCQDLTPPPANLDTTPPGLDPKLTTRERFAKHTADTKCSGCHKFIDGVGFGLEGFDGVGMKRDKENNLPVDTSGEIVGLEKMNDGTKQPFNGPRELGAMLAESETAQDCMTLQFYRFARGYQEQERDACSLERMKERFEGKDLTVKELLVSIATLDSFTVRGE